MKKMSPVAYRSLFLKHVWRFIEMVSTQKEREGNHAVAVSGGRDSMSLLWFLARLREQEKIGPVRAVFVHHHTRPGQDKDLLLVKNFCRQEKIPFKELHLQGLDTVKGNFEARARKERKKALQEESKNDELLWMGQHLNDSFEWNFMQRNRSTTPRSSVGIPVRNRKIIRPFLCVTREQIKRLATFEGISYREDPSNRDLRYDRNFIRHKIVPLIKARYPKYLKFYANFANFSAMMLKISMLARSGTSKLFVYEEGAILLGKHFSELQIQELIHTYSKADRGEIMTPIERMLRAIGNGKKGPFHFSGGLEAYSSSGLLMIYPQRMKNYDDSIAAVLSELSKNTLSMMPTFNKTELESAWLNLLQTPDALCNLPGLLLVLESDSICKTLNTSVFDPLFPLVSEVCKQKGLRFLTFQKCLDVWMQKKEKLPERLRLVPLSNLSHLFTSQ